MPVALVLPGWGTSRARLGALVDGLADAGLDARPWTYDATGSVRAISGRLADAVAAIGSDVHLVGHSLGGLASAAAVLHHGASVRSVTTVNAPWRGTWAAWTARPDDPLGHELRWGSDALADLRERLDAHLDEPDGPRWHVLSAAGDLAATALSALRVPTGGRLEKSLVPVRGHSISLLHPRMVDAVAEGVASLRHA